MVEQVVQLLIQERDRLSRAIEALQGPTKRRGRPPKNAVAIDGAAAPPGEAEETNLHGCSTESIRPQNEKVLGGEEEGGESCLNHSSPRVEDRIVAGNTLVESGKFKQKHF